MSLAVRVLTALNFGETPDPHDVAQLKALDPSVGDTASLDERACDVIQQALKRRAEMRDGKRTMTA